LLKRLAFLASVIALLGAGHVEPAPAPAPHISRDVFPGVSIPVLVPTLLPRDYGRVFLVPHVGPPWATTGGYAITIGSRPDCDGSVCEYAHVDGSREPQHLDGRPSHVTLADGAHATYVQRGCTVNCDDSNVLVLRREHAYYTIGMKGGNLARLLTIANGLERI
jgi:hypothetical protein